jgi:hypothetical protein
VRWPRLVPSRPATRLLAGGIVASTAAVVASAALAETGGGDGPQTPTQRQAAVTSVLPGWTAVNRGDGTRVEFAKTRTSRVLKLADGRGDGFAGISKLLHGRTQVVVRARVKVLRHGLKPGASRPLVWVGGDRGHSQQAGIIRAPRQLRWATWRVTPSGRRVDVAVSRRTRVHMDAWQTVTFVSDWAGRETTSLSTGTKPVVGSGPARIGGARANRVTLALGKASKPGDKAVMLVRRAKVATRGPRASEPVPAPAPPPAVKLAHEHEPYAPTFAFNELIPAGAPSDPRSPDIVSQLIENVASSKIVLSSAGEVPPVYVAKPTDPFYSVSVGGTQTRFRVPEGVQAGGGADSPLVILDPYHPDFGPQTELRLWQASVGSGSLSASGAGLFHYNNDGAPLNPDKSPSHSIAFEGGGTGSGLSILAGLIRPEEVRMGRINHALRFAYSAADFSNRYRAPAIRTDQPKNTSTRNAATAIDMGMRLQLDPAVDCAARTVPGRANTSPETRFLRIVCKALQEYGMMPMDGTGDRTLLFQMEGDATADWSSVIGSEHNDGWGYIVRDQTTPDDGLSRDDTSGIPWDLMRVLARSDF